MIDFDVIWRDRTFGPPWDDRKRAELRAEVRWRLALFGNVWASADRQAETVTLSIVPPTAAESRRMAAASVEATPDPTAASPPRSAGTG